MPTSFWENPLQGLIAQQIPSMVDPTTGLPTQAPVNPMGGDFQRPGLMDRFGAFAASPQGNAALMAFANAALQASMNPRTRGGAGMLGALNQGMMGYKAKGEQEEEDRRREELLEYQRAGEEREAAKFPGQMELQAEQIKKAKAPDEAEFAFKIGALHNFTNGDYTQEKRLVARNNKTGEETWVPTGKPRYTGPRAQPEKPRKPAALPYTVVGYFLDKGLDNIKTVDDLAKLTPAQRTAFYNEVKKNPAMSGPLGFIMQMEQSERMNPAAQEPIVINPEELK